MTRSFRAWVERARYGGSRKGEQELYSRPLPHALTTSPQTWEGSEPRLLDFETRQSLNASQEPKAARRERERRGRASAGFPNCAAEEGPRSPGARRIRGQSIKSRRTGKIVRRDRWNLVWPSNPSHPGTPNAQTRNTNGGPAARGSGRLIDRCLAHCRVPSRMVGNDDAGVEIRKKAGKGVARRVK